MAGTGTKTATTASTYTAVRAKDVTQKAMADLLEFVASGHLTRERLDRFFDDLRQMLDYEAVEHFEFQIDKPNGERCGLLYRVDDSGSATADDENRAVSAWGLPSGSRGSFMVKLRAASLKDQRFCALLERLGWTAPGRALEGTVQQDRIYSKDGYGLRRGVIGSFT